MAIQREEQVQLHLPLSASSILNAIAAFKQQFGQECYLYVTGHVTIATGELCAMSDWLPVVRPDPELDLLGIGDPSMGEEDETLLWVAPTRSCFLLLSTSPLHG